MGIDGGVGIGGGGLIRIWIWKMGDEGSEEIIARYMTGAKRKHWWLDRDWRMWVMWRGKRYPACQMRSIIVFLFCVFLLL